MKNYPRRAFVKNSAALLAIVLAGAEIEAKTYQPLLSFSTLGCPDWSFQKIVLFAKQNGYKGIEIRTIQREMELPKCTVFSSKEKIAATNRFVKDNGVKIINLGASTSLHHSNLADRKKNLDEAKRFLDLADQLNCPYIRVFPDKFPKDQDRSATLDLIAKGLIELGNYAKGSNVTVLLETHGEVVKANDLATIMKNAAHKQVGLIWDIVNMWAVTKERPVDVYAKLKKYIRHAHIKDMNLVNGKEQYTLLSRGETPVFEGIDALAKGNFKGYFSFEWEKLWHPEIPEPEIALADYPKVM
ncbi:MAG: sugar phosphate isomerase/epimerase family protein, partial [Chitinophagaceae bacterium]